MDNNLLYPGTPSMLQPSGTGAVKSDPSPANRNSELPPPAAGLPQPVAAPTAPVAPVLGNGTINGTTTYGHEPWGSTPNAQFLAPSVMSLMGMDTSGAQPGMLFNTQTQRWEIPPPEWAAMGGAHAGSFGPGAPAPAPAPAPSHAATAEHVTTHINSLLDGTHPALKTGTAGTTGSTTQPTGTTSPAPMAYDPNKPVEGQLQQALGNKPYSGTWQSTLNDPTKWSVGSEQIPEGGGDAGVTYRTVKTYTSKDGRAVVHQEPNGAWRLVVDGSAVPVPWKDDDPHRDISDPGSAAHSNIGDLADYSKLYYDPEYGLLTPANNVKDTTRSSDKWYDAAIMSAVAGPAIGGILGAEGVWTANNPFYNGSPALAPGAPPAVTPGPGAPGSPPPATTPAPGTPGPEGPPAATTPPPPPPTGEPPPPAATTPPPAVTPPPGPGLNPGALLNPAARALLPGILGHVLNPGSTTHPGSPSGNHGTPGAPGATGSPGTGNAYDALGQSLIDNKPLSDAARATLLNHGKPTDDQTSAINAGLAEHRRIGQEQILQASANSGQGGADSMVVQDKMRAFDTQLETQRQELMQKQAEANTSNALQELGYVSKEALAYAELQFREDESMQQLYMGLFDALGKLYGTTPGTTGNNTKVPGVPTPDPKPDPEGDPDPNDGIPTDPNGELQFDP